MTETREGFYSLRHPERRGAPSASCPAEALDTEGMWDPQIDRLASASARQHCVSLGWTVRITAGGEASLGGAGHSDQSAFRILEMADNESIG